MDGILVLMALVVIVGSICGLIAVVRAVSLGSKLDSLEREVGRMRRTLERMDVPPAVTPAAAPVPPPPAAAERTVASSSARAPRSPAATIGDRTAEPTVSTSTKIAEHLRENWMIWLGGLCVALAGVFLARYSIEQGLLGPRARVTLGVMTGLALHAGAEYLRRRTGEAHPAFAALAGGGSITLFAALLASLHLYQQISPTTAFLMMAAIGLATMWLAYLHGPALAAIGIVGAYLVPALVSSGEGRVLIALTYSLVISGSALLLMRFVFRKWLWWGFVVGVLFWWGVTIFDHKADGFRGAYLAIAAYLMLAIPHFDWLLRRPVELLEERFTRQSFSALEIQDRLASFAFVLLIAAQAVSIWVEADFARALWIWSPLVIVGFQASRHREYLVWVPALLLGAQGLAWLGVQLQETHGHWQFALLGSPEDRQFLVYLAGTTLLYSALSFRNLARCRFKAVWSAVGTVTPVLCLAIGYLFTSRLLVSWQWGAVALLFGSAYLAIATASLKRSTPESLVVWLYFGGHFALSLAAVMLLKETTLTLSIAALVVSTAWIIHTFRLPALGWVMKLLVAIVIIRLTLNPWLASYPSGTNWPLWTYGGSALLCAVAAFRLRSYPMLARWAEGATLHLFVLTLWAEVRYWLHDGEVFAQGFKPAELGIYTSLFATLSIVYYRRGLASEYLRKLYAIFSAVLMAGAAFCYLVILGATLLSLRWLWREVGETPILNLTLLLYLAPVLVFAVASYFHRPTWRRYMLLSTGLTFFIYVSLQIKHLWQASIRLDLPVSDPELYTYSIVWLLMAVAGVLGGAWRYGPSLYRAGMVLLALVIAKLFLVDLSGLEGLLRVASFMGLGLSLLGISYLHQRIKLSEAYQAVEGTE